MDLQGLLRDTLRQADDFAARTQMSSYALRFGDLPVTVRVDETGPTQQLLAMMASRAAAPSPDSTLITILGCSLNGCERLLPPAEKRQGTVILANRDIYYLWLNEADGYLTAIDRKAGRGLVWFTAPDRIASWHVARPLLHAIKGLSENTSWTPIHAAAVAQDGKGILIVGQSGAGKTSIAMTCAVGGWDYLGDDAVIVRPEPARVAALYSSARLREDTFARFPEIMAACLRISDDAGEPKAEIDMASLRPLTAKDAEIRAIVVPQPTDWTELRLERMSRSNALRKLMEATRQSIIGDEASTFAKLASLVQKVPTYALVAGGDRAQLTAALARLLRGEGIA